MTNTFTISEIASICQGVFIHKGKDTRITTLLTDSRKLVNVKEALFFAISGINHDGHDYIPALIEAGVTHFIVERDISFEPGTSINLIRVNSSLKALQQLGASKRANFNGPVIGITGSNGKTIVKEWLAAMLSAQHQVAKSPRSYNSQLGVPLSVWELEANHELGVFEAGISLSGEMKSLQEIINPTHGILTNIGTAHEEGFASRAEKLEEKLSLFEQSEVLIYRADVPEIAHAVRSMKPGPKKLLGWGFDPSADLFIKHEAENLFSFHQDEEHFSLRLPFERGASLENLLHGIVMLRELGHSPTLIQEMLAEINPVGMRLKLIRGKEDSYLIDDTYNNDLAGLETALDFLQHQKQHAHKVVILSDLPQVNDKSGIYAKVNQLLAEKSVNQLIGIGPELNKHRAIFEIESSFFDSTEAFLNADQTEMLEKAVILVKGARKFHFEQIVERLSEKTHHTQLEINLDAISHNLNFYRSRLKPGVKVMVMVKAFAYGSGIAEIAQLLQFHKVHYLAVAYTDEGVELRKNGIHLPIMVMNAKVSDLDLLIRHDLEPELFSGSQLREFQRLLGPMDTQLKVHVNINTGMNRLGFESAQMPELIETLSSAENIEVASIFTHLAGADEAEHEAFSLNQIKVFESAAQEMEETLGISVLKHALNSAGILRFPNSQMDMVRLGIGLYGVEVNYKEAQALEVVGRLTTVISQIKHIKAGDTIGYGRKGLAKEDMVIATVAIGYADGYSRAFSNGVGHMLVHGQPAPVIGNVCMDMCMLDISGIEAQEGDLVTVFGKDPDITELARQINTIPYEILTNVSSRVKRVYSTE